MAGSTNGSLVLNRWKRYGHDRLYAETAGGTKLGYLDLNTDVLHPADPDDLPLRTAAVASDLNQASAGVGKHVDTTPTRIPTPARLAETYVARHAVVDWIDTGDTEPGPPAAACDRPDARLGAR